MKKQLLEEINRFRELVSLKPINLINESFVQPFLKKVGLEAIEKEISVFVKQEAEEIIKQELKKGTLITSVRGGQQGIKAVSKESVEKVIKEIEAQSSKTLTRAQKGMIEVEIRKALVEEGRLAATEFAKIGADIGKSVSKQSNKKSTWQVIKEHIKRNKGKYLIGAAAAALAAYAYFYPGETPEDEDEVVTTTTTTIPQGGKWRKCSGTYSRGCYETEQDGPIHQVQTCIGTTSDGKFGSKTEADLKQKTGKTSFTDADVEAICGGSNEDNSENENEGGNNQRTDINLDDF
jgi:hypothetical protein